MRTELLTLMITAAAVVVAYYAIGAVNPSGIHAADATDAQIIRGRSHLRFTEPEWVSRNGSIMMSWIIAETKARLGVIAFFWLWVVACVIRFEGFGNEIDHAK